jgi:hypothetical protein
LDGILRPSTHGFWSSVPRASVRSPGFSPPFSTRCRAMRFDSGTIDQDLLGWPSGLRERTEQTDPDPLGRPADIAVVEGLPRPVVWRRVDPATTRLQHIDDPADHPTIVNPRLASRVCRQMRFDLRKLLGRKPEMIPIHLRFLSEAVNHKSIVMPTTLWVRTLIQMQTNRRPSDHAYM